MVVCVGDDWSEAHHDICVMDETGERLAVCRLEEGVEGLRGFHELVAEYVDDPSGVVVGIETDRGLWVSSLVAAGYQVYAVNPRSVARYRERHTVSGAKSDRGDAKVLADLVRTDRHNHRRVAGDSPEAEAVKALARAHKSLVDERKRHANRLRSSLREYYPAALAAFEDLKSTDALAVLARAPSPQVGARLTVTQIRAALKRGGRQRYLDHQAERIHTALKGEYLAASEEMTAALAASTKATVAIISELNRQITELESVMSDRFRQHPDAPIYLSMPGLGVVLGARALGEFGDDPNRYADVKSRRNYAATSPVTIASGNKKGVAARWVRNDRLYNTMIWWAFCSLTQSPGARTFYDQRRAAGDGHYKALRALANRWVGLLHGCLQHHTPYNEHTAWAHRQSATPQAA